MNAQLSVSPLSQFGTAARQHEITPTCVQASNVPIFLQQGEDYQYLDNDEAIRGLAEAEVSFENAMSGRPFSRSNSFDNWPEIHSVGEVIPSLMLDQLQVFLASSAKSLQENPSHANVEAVLLSVLDQTSALVAAHVPIPSLPTPNNSARKIVFKVFQRAARLLGRNTIESIKVDAKKRIKLVSERIAAYDQHQHKNIEGWIATEVTPHLDPDMEQVAGALEIYRHEHDYEMLMSAREKLTRAYNILASKRRPKHSTVEQESDVTGHNQPIGAVPYGDLELTAQPKRRHTV